MRKLGEKFTPRVGLTRTIAVTRPVGGGEETSQLVRKLGWTPFIFHTVELKPLESAEIITKLSKVLSEASVDWLVFMSPRGVDLVFEALGNSNGKLRNLLGKIRILAVGPKTGEELSRRGIQHPAVPQTYSSTGIVEYLSEFELRGRGVVLTRSSTADHRLAKSLEGRGAIIHTVQLYQSSIPHSKQTAFDFLEGLLDDQFQAVLFTSASSVSNLFGIMRGKFDRELVISALSERLVGAIGPVTAEKLRELGINPIVPERFLIENAVRRITEIYDSSMKRV